MKNFRLLLAFAALVALAGCGKPQEASKPPVPKIRVGYTNTTSFTGLFVAKERGLFSRHGLDVELVPLALNSIIPSALAGSSLEIGGTTPSVFLQAVEGGIDMVEVAGGAVNDVNVPNGGVVAATGSAIHGPKDFEGKRVGVPGLGAYMHILFVRWLSEKGVDLKKVSFVEVPLAQSSDILRSGNVDAMLAGEPFFGRILEAGTGHLVSPYLTEMPDGLFAIYYASRRDWAQRNADTLQKFRAALAEAADYIAKNPAEARRILGRATHLPPAVAEKSVLPTLRLAVPASDMDYWAATLVSQNVLKGRPDAAKLMLQ